MTQLEFRRHFPDASSRQAYIMEGRQMAGICRKTCKPITKHRWLSGDKIFECSSCRGRGSLKSGTLMECSKVYLHHLLFELVFLSATKSEKGEPNTGRVCGFGFWINPTKVPQIRRDSMVF